MAELTIINGLAGGVVATIAMTILMMALGDDSPPPTAEFLAKYVGDKGAEEYMMPGMVLHLLYGTTAGIVFVLAASAAGLTIASMTTAVLFGLGYGVVMFIVAAVFWMNIVLDMDAEPPMVVMFLVFHLVYGGVLGVVLELGLV